MGRAQVASAHTAGMSTTTTPSGATSVLPALDAELFAQAVEAGSRAFHEKRWQESWDHVQDIHKDATREDFEAGLLAALEPLVQMVAQDLIPRIPATHQARTTGRPR